MYKAVKAGFKLEGRFFNTEIGTPQGSVMSPILANVLMHKLDLYMENLKGQFDTGKTHRINSEYKRLLRTGQMKIIRERYITSRMPYDTQYKRLQYVRYADDFLIGVIGSKSDCESLRLDIRNFLEDSLKMKLNIDKTKITHAREDMALFLGTNVRITPPSLRPLVHYERNNVKRIMTSSTRPLLYIPMSRILERLENRGLHRGGHPTS
jgi:hypothetical protein